MRPKSESYIDSNEQPGDNHVGNRFTITVILIEQHTKLRYAKLERINIS